MQHTHQALENGILRLSFNRPERKNAITTAMYDALARALDQANSDPAVRVVLLTGQPGVFTSGNDIQDFLNNPPSDAQSPVFRFLHALSHLEKPLIAAVDGLAVGVGTTLLLHCDLVYATPEARFQLPFVNLGLVPEAASSFLLPRVAGYQRAAEMLLLGEVFTAEQALAAGMLNGILPSNQLLEHALGVAHKLTEKPAQALRLTKQLLKQPYLSQIEQTMRAEGVHFIRQLGSPEAREAFSAFIEKRKPDFSKLG
ncbi:enoyl-CoA hydratase [Meiothermus cerbereus]|uniref:enoyl-CoA hydratase n=1 Tax=Meiothermus cerbereus TaxID=65552 RepID=UPI003EF02CF6